MKLSKTDYIINRAFQKAYIPVQVVDVEIQERLMKEKRAVSFRAQSFRGIVISYLLNEEQPA